MAYNIHEEIVVEPRQYKNKESSLRRFCRRARQTENKKSSLRRRFPSMLCRGNFFLIRGIEMKFTFLSEAFYNEHIDHTEIEKKHDRPYVQVIIKVSSVFFAVPMRSNINHKHAFFSHKEERCGVDLHI